MKDNKFNAPEPIFKTDEIKDADQFEHIGQSGFSATWNNIRYTGSKLQGNIRFTSSGSYISAIGTNDFAVIDCDGVEQTGWAFDSVLNLGNLNVDIPIAATPPANTNGEFGLRMKALTARDNPSRDQVPPNNVDSAMRAAVDNRPLDNQDQFRLDIDIPQNEIGTMQISVKPNSFNVTGSPSQTGPTTHQYLGSVDYNTIRPFVTIRSGGFDGDDTVHFYAYWENASTAQLSNFDADDISVTGAGNRNTAAVGQPPNGYIVTLGSAMGSAYPFSVSGLPDNTNSTLKVIIRANALGNNTNLSAESSCIPYDTRKIPELVNIDIPDQLEVGDNNVFLEWNTGVNANQVIKTSFQFEGMDTDFNDNMMDDDITIRYRDPIANDIPSTTPSDYPDSKLTSAAANNTKRKNYLMTINIPSGKPVPQGILRIYVKGNTITNDTQ